MHKQTLVVYVIRKSFDGQCLKHIYVYIIQGYLWEDDRTVVEWLSEQLDENNTKNTLEENMRCLQRDHVIHQVRG